MMTTRGFKHNHGGEAGILQQLAKGGIQIVHIFD